MKPRGLVEAWAAGLSTVGASCKIASALVAECVASTGFDYIYIDQQHGVFDDQELLSMLQAVAAGGAAPVTRVPSNRPELIHKSLDFGADGVIVPLVETEADAVRALEACRYPPTGRRSYGVLRPRVSAEIGGYQPACIVLVETATGIANLDAIARTGVDAIMVGPHDLSLSLGLSVVDAGPGSPELVAAIDQVVAACARYGVVAGIGSSSGHEAAVWLKRGFRLVNVGNDLGYIRTSLATQLARARSALPSGGLNGS
jgi:4-hydroxy-2-oxoheptanedioate aldolase